MAVLTIAGKQFLVSSGDKFKVMRLQAKEGDVLLYKDELSGRDVKVKVISESRGKKIRVVKFKKKTGYRRTIGSRSFETLLEVVA